MTLAQIKTGQLKATLPNTSTPVRQMQLQQIPIAQQQRKAAGKMTQITQVAGTSVATSSAGGNVTGTVTGVTKGSPIGTTQLIVQNPKNLQPGTVTVQQIQQVMRQQPNQIVVGKNLGRIIPVSVSSQPNARQTIQVIFPAQTIDDRQPNDSFFIFNFSPLLFRLFRLHRRKDSPPARSARIWLMPAWEPRTRSKWQPVLRRNKRKPSSMRCNSSNKCNVRILAKTFDCKREARSLPLPFSRRQLFRNKVRPSQLIRLPAPVPPPRPSYNHRHKISRNR